MPDGKSVRRTLDEIRASEPKIDHAKVRATTEADIRRHMIKDGSDPAAPLPTFVKRRYKFSKPEEPKP